MNALEVALHTLLSGDTALMSHVSAVYTAGISAPAYPYLRVRKTAEAPPQYSYQHRILRRYHYDIVAVAKGESKAAIGSAIARAKTLLELQTLTVTGYTCHRITSLGDMPDMAERDADGVMLNQVGTSFEIVLS